MDYRRGGDSPTPGGDWAWMWTKLRVEATMPDGKPMTRSGHTLTILRKEKGRRVLARDANLLT